MRRCDAAYGLAILLREVAETVTIYTFSDHARMVPPRRGLALRDALDHSQAHGCTFLDRALAQVESACCRCDRLVVITDEQTHDEVGSPARRGYLINVAGNRNGVGYGDWHHIDGWSEAAVDYIAEFEASQTIA
jgi:hypothetical protein